MNWIKDTSSNGNEPVNLALIRKITLKKNTIVFYYDQTSPDSVWSFKEEKDAASTYKYIISTMKGI